MSNSRQQTLEIGFEAFLQELPAEYHPLAYEFKVFTRGRKFKSPADVMQAVMDYCGLDFSLREVAGHFSLLEERVSDTAVHKRLKACLPWVKALLERMFGSCSEGLIAGGLRFVVVDGSTVQVPGAQGTSYRLCDRSGEVGDLARGSDGCPRRRKLGTLSPQGGRCGHRRSGL